MNPDGYIGPYESGELYGAAGVFLFVLAIGIFITMAMRPARSTTASLGSRPADERPRARSSSPS